jgi:hypothetical protein
MKVSTEIDNNFGYEKITQLVDNIPLNDLSSRANIRQTDIDNAVQKIADKFTNGAKEIFGNIENGRNNINKKTRNRGSVENVL